MIDCTWWGDGHHRAELFRSWFELGYQRLVVRYWERIPAAVETDVDSWAEVGRALIDIGRKEEARKLMAAWRERVGVPMSAVANYVLCFSRLEEQDLQEVLSSCTAALADLTHDNCAKYLAHVKAETCALLGDADAFRRTWLEHKGYFTGRLEKGEWFENPRRHLLSDIPRLAELLERNQTEDFRSAGQELREKQYSPPPVSTVGESPGTGEVPTWIWWILLVLALGSVMNSWKHTPSP